MAADTSTPIDPIPPAAVKPQSGMPDLWARLTTHALAIALVVAAVWLAQVDLGRAVLALPPELAQTATPQAVAVVAQASPTPTLQPLILEVPPEAPTADGAEIIRLADVHTIIPTRPRYEVQKYTVVANDTLFVIAGKFNLEPETILWGNAFLAEDPNVLSVGQELNILPVNGALRIVQAGDTIEKIATVFHGTVEEIINFPGNDLDPSDPVLVQGQNIIIPNGYRDLVVWQLPVITRTTVGVSSASGEPGACSGPFSGPTGTFTFAWPAANHFLSGTNYLPIGHPGIDIAAGLGAPIYASDTGVIVFAGWSYRGYGNLVIIDHGNGWQTAYAHLSQINVTCGGAIYQGQVLGLAGSTGNSTGSHLHFEMRSASFGRVNPFNYLP